jgi:hypothetical protein
LSVSEDLKPFLKARVVDVRDYGATTSSEYIVDTNVLVFSTYDRYDQQRLLGKRVPTDATIDEYLRYEKRVRAAGSRLYIASAAVFEFLRTVERAELEILWATKDHAAALGDFSNFDLKKVRRVCFKCGYNEAQRNVVTYLNSLAKRFTLLEVSASFAGFADRCTHAWIGTVIDTGDAIQLSEAKSKGITSVISDDQDFATLEGITQFTANRTIIDTARSVGLLVPTE